METSQNIKNFSGCSENMQNSPYLEQSDLVILVEQSESWDPFSKVYDRLDGWCETFREIVEIILVGILGQVIVERTSL